MATRYNVNAKGANTKKKVLKSSKKSVCSQEKNNTKKKDSVRTYSVSGISTCKKEDSNNSSITSVKGCGTIKIHHDAKEIRRRLKIKDGATSKIGNVHFGESESLVGKEHKRKYSRGCQVKSSKRVRTKRGGKGTTTGSN